MTLEYFIKGLIIGFSVAAPVGPIGILCIRRALTESRVAGFVTGLGASIADTVYGLIAGFGLTVISVFLMEQEFWMKLAGGFFLMFLGVKTFVSRPASREAEGGKDGLLNHFISTFFLTITNPATILSFLAIFAGLGLGASDADYSSSLSLVFGVFLGSAAWWMFLSWIASRFQSKITPDRFVWINRGSGALISAFGMWALYSCMLSQY